MNITWLIIIVAVMLVLQSWLFRYLGPRKLSYQRYFNVKSCYAGDQVEMVERIANRKLVPVPWLRLESALSADLKFSRQQGHTISEGQLFQNHRSLFSLMPYTQVVRRHQITCTKRGYYELNTATLTVGDLFGIFSLYRKLSLNLQLIVYPRPILPDATDIPSHSWQGDFTVRRWIVDDPFMFSGVREYQYGDSLSDLNWKATARSGKMQVNQHDFTSDRRVMVYLNIEDHEKMWNQVSDEALIEKGISYAAGIIQEAIHSGMEAGFATNAYLTGGAKESLRIDPAGGRGHYEYILEQMARLSISRSVSFDVFLEQELRRSVKNMDIIVITTYMNDELHGLAEQLVRGGNSLEVLPLAATTGDRDAASAEQEYQDRTKSKAEPVDTVRTERSGVTM